MGTGVMGGVSLATGLGLTGTASAAKTCAAVEHGREDEFITETAQSIGKFIEEQPEAEGLRDLEQFMKNHYPVEFGSEDDRILQGALYMEARRLFEMRAERPSHEKLVEGLSSPIDVSPMNPDYFRRMLERTKARIACDPLFAEEHAEAAERFIGLTLGINCHGRWWLCGGIIVVVVVVVVILL
ncbi:hypothetical protein [Archangium primigenium]|uniref:hypothetical protein n=1 Tax=[Archangium] primigenium TaxID=2792470 RepID=UPI001959392D|nr:hypothetical protein [Archangium primigenium]MBM7114026.1 hypothetical protein [Archangium primigenium]